MRIRLRATRETALCVLATTSRGSRRNPPRSMPMRSDVQSQLTIVGPRAVCVHLEHDVERGPCDCPRGNAGVPRSGVGATGKRPRGDAIPRDHEVDIERAVARHSDTNERDLEDESVALCIVAGKRQLRSCSRGPDRRGIGEPPAPAEAAEVGQVGDLDPLADAKPEGLRRRIEPIPKAAVAPLRSHVTSAPLSPSRVSHGNASLCGCSRGLRRQMD